MRYLPTVVMFDLDSTMCNTEHRHFMADEAKMSGDWEAYSLECINDEPIVGTLTALRLLYPYHQIHFVSGRGEVARSNTMLWLADYDAKYDHLEMYDRRMWPEKPSNGDIKVRYIRKLRERGLTPVLFFEDWWETAEAIEAEGVPVVCINPRYKSGPLTTHL